jgi:cell division septation protein DedD
MADEGFHEIPLGGKQLVFLFMAAVVVAVVIFLCGVMVGRGVRAEKAGVAAGEPAPVAPSATADLGSSAAAPAGTPATGKGQQATADDDANYYNRLSKETTPPDTLKPPAEVPPAAGEPAPAKAPKQTAKKAAAADVAPGKSDAAPPATSGEPAGPGLRLQVAAFRDGAAAEAVATRLKAKGYPAYVLAPSTDSLFRVRVGRYKTKKEADDAMRRLEKEEQFKPSLIR